MKTTGKKIMITGAVVFAVGIIFTIIGFLLGGWPGFQISHSGVSAANKIEKPYELSKTKIDKFTTADITLDYANIDLRVSEDNFYYIEYLLDGNTGEPVYQVNNESLKFKQKNRMGSFMFLGSIDNNLAANPYVCLYIPKDAKLNSLILNSDSGDFELNSIKAESAKIGTEYGTCNITDSTFDDLAFSVESSDLEIKNSTAKNLSFIGSYGEISLKNFSSESILMDLESYDVSIEATNLGNLDYKNEYGELELTLPEKMDIYSFNIFVEYGDIDLPDSAPLGNYSDNDDSEKTYRFDGSSDKKINITCESGDVEIHQED